MSIVLHSQVNSAFLDWTGLLVWDDGEIWRRLQTEELYDGRWVSSASPATFLIHGLTVQSAFGEVFRVLRRERALIVVEIEGREWPAKFDGIRLRWENGTTWSYVSAGALKHEELEAF